MAASTAKIRLQIVLHSNVRISNRYLSDIKLRSRQLEVERNPAKTHC